MKINPKSEKGAITLIVLVTMFFLLAFLMSMYIGIANKAKSSAETTKQITQKYNNIGQADAIYDSYFADGEIIPITTVAELKKIASGEKITIDGKIYTFSENAYYALQNNLNLGGYYNEETKTWTADEDNEWIPLTSSFTGTLDGLGHTITGLYINNPESTKQGLFGTLKGTVKNLNILGSYINAKDYVGAIAGLNEGIIKNCYNKATIIGNNYVGGMAGNLTENIVNCYNTGTIIGTTNVTGGYFKSIETGEEIDVWSDKVLDENAYFVSGTYTATAPKGFKVSKNVFEQTIIDGMVIQDAEENEFVWIPVEITENDTKESISSFYRSDWVTDDANGGARGTTIYTDTEPNASNAWELEEYNEMVESVYNNRGFYIGRYEAGCTTPRALYAADDTSITDEQRTSKVIIKRDAYPYTYVGWGASTKDYTSDVIHTSKSVEYNQGKGAVFLSKQLYGKTDDEGKYGVVSTLCYGIQWDAILEFVKDETHGVVDSTTWGNYSENKLTIKRTTAQYFNNAQWVDIPDGGYYKSTAKLLTTGADDSFAAKNIYDIAGNCWEWTMEVKSSSRVNRGGGSNSGEPASSRDTRSFMPKDCLDNFTFRPSLYIK